MKAIIKVQINEDVYYCDRAKIYKDHILLIDDGDGAVYANAVYFKPRKDTPVLSIYYVDSQ